MPTRKHRFVHWTFHVESCGDWQMRGGQQRPRADGIATPPTRSPSSLCTYSLLWHRQEAVKLSVSALPSHHLFKWPQLAPSISSGLLCFSWPYSNSQGKAGDFLLHWACYPSLESAALGLELASISSWGTPACKEQDPAGEQACKAVSSVTQPGALKEPSPCPFLESTVQICWSERSYCWPGGGSACWHTRLFVLQD